MLERGDAIVNPSSFGKTVILTVSTIGLGAAVLAGAALSSNAGSKPNDAVADQSEISRLPKSTKTPNIPYRGQENPNLPPSDLGKTPAELTNLVNSINVLKNEVVTLQGKIDDAGLVGLPKTIEDINAKLENLDGVVGKPGDNAGDNTLNGQMKDFSVKLGEEIKEFQTSWLDLTNSWEVFRKSIRCFKECTIWIGESVSQPISTLR